MSKEAKICYLKDEQGDFISPITNENSIFNDEGNNSFENINQRLLALENALGQKILDYTFEDSTTVRKSFDISLKPDEMLDGYIYGASLDTPTDEALSIRINNITDKVYHQVGCYLSETQLITGIRDREYFYYTCGLFQKFSTFKFKMWIQKNLDDNLNYCNIITYTPRSYVNSNLVGSMNGIITQSLDEVTKITFGWDEPDTSTRYHFREGTRIVLKKNKIFL